jgi:hypothetical protein
VDKEVESEESERDKKSQAAWASEKMRSARCVGNLMPFEARTWHTPGAIVCMCAPKALTRSLAGWGLCDQRKQTQFVLLP